MSKQTSIELPYTHAENPVGQSVAVKRKRGRPAKQTTVKLDETVETASTSAEHSCGKSSAARRGRRITPTLTPTIKAKAVTLEELQKADGGWFTIKPAVTIVALCWDRYYYHRCVECRMIWRAVFELKISPIELQICALQLEISSIQWINVKTARHRMRALPNAEGKYGCAQHPTAKTKEIYCLRILLRQDDLNMWVTAFLVLSS